MPKKTTNKVTTEVNLGDIGATGPVGASGQEGPVYTPVVENEFDGLPVKTIAELKAGRKALQRWVTPAPKE